MKSIRAHLVAVLSSLALISLSSSAFACGEDKDEDTDESALCGEDKDEDTDES
jgi:hypothetical protein